MCGVFFFPWSDEFELGFSILSFEQFPNLSHSPEVLRLKSLDK